MLQPVLETAMAIPVDERKGITGAIASALTETGGCRGGAVIATWSQASCR